MLIYLYVKQHSITKLKYFGKTMKRDPFKYLGSGTRWLNHINKHGKSNVTTLDVWGFDDQDLCTAFALKFSEDNDIVNSPEWANLRPENGIDGLPANFNGHMTPERRSQHSVRWKEQNPNDLPGAKERQREAIKGDKNPAKRFDVREKLKGPRPGFLPHNHYIGWKQEVKDKIAQTLTGHVRSAESISKQKESRKDLIWIQHSTEKSIQIKASAFDEYEKLGYSKGRGKISHREIMPVDDFIALMKNLNIKTVNDWKTYFKNNQTPDNVFYNQKREYDIRDIPTTWKQLLGK